jgi:dihydrolipoamide dehydrogenase
VIASGSKSIVLPALKFDGRTVISSDEAIALDSVPEKLVVVGAGAIGLELGSVWARLGSKVTVVEFLPQVAPAYDEDVSKYAERLLKKQGMTFHLGAKVTGLKHADGKTLVTADQNGKALEIEADKVLVAVGRVPCTEGLDLEAAGVTLDSRGRIEVNEVLCTKADSIWAIGDVIAGPMLAHKAEEEGIAVAERVAGRRGHVNYDVIPNVIYTCPRSPPPAHRAPCEAEGHRGQGRQIPHRGQWPRRGRRRCRRLHQGHRRQGDR